MYQMYLKYVKYPPLLRFRSICKCIACTTAQRYLGRRELQNNLSNIRIICRECIFGELELTDN